MLVGLLLESVQETQVSAGAHIPWHAKGCGNASPLG